MVVRAMETWEMVGQERASSTTFLWPGRCWKDALNSERKERWRC